MLRYRGENGQLILEHILQIAPAGEDSMEPDQGTVEVGPSNQIPL
ncbi:unnamed protein product [Strongylus vulgaris]|uniref:Uncharacterized protein n=1 Tax=Strongylus vulgaris TaxID=40348 RepID=A0A3P7JLH5_STRVU|nr:unnamed protein product [Strongylus vulgaris]